MTATPTPRSLAPPVVPAASTAQRPLPAGAATITGGFWGERLETNRARAIHGGYERLEDSGMLRNLHIAAGTEHGEVTPLIFADSDLYKWLEAAAYEVGRTGDAQLLELQRRVTGWIAAAQDEGGYLNTVHDQKLGKGRRWTNLTDNHELYCAGHLIQAAIAQRRCTGDTGLLEVATRFADLIADTFGPQGRDGTPGHPEIEMALVELFRETGQQRYLEIAEFFLDRRGHGVLHAERGVNPSYYSDRVPVREATSVEGHAVRAIYLAAGATDRAIEDGNAEHLAQQEALFDDMMRTKAYVSGGLGARWEGEAFGAPYELPPDRGYAETCAAIAAVQWAWRLLLATERPRYADAIEHLLLNAMLPGISLDGTRYFYVNPLQTRSGAVIGDARDPAGGRQGWFDCACCPPNVMRTLASLAQYVATADEHGLHLHQYAQGSYSSGPLGSGDAALAVEVATDYPRDGRITVTVMEAPAAEAALTLRIPAWAQSPSLAAPEHLVQAPAEGAVQLRGTFTAGDRIVLDLPLEARFVVGHLRNDAVAGGVALFRGPLLYALEQQDQVPGADIEQLAVLPDQGVDLAETPATLAALPSGNLPALSLTARHLRPVSADPYPAWGPSRRWGSRPPRQPSRTSPGRTGRPGPCAYGSRPCTPRPDLSHRPDRQPPSARRELVTDPARSLATGLTAALSPTITGSRATGPAGPRSSRTDGPARVVIDLDLPGATISRHLYGHFAEHLGRCIYGGFYVGEDSEIPNVRGIRTDVVEALRALRIPNLRWPGGCFADDYHWRDGIGPREDRPRMVNSHWGDIVEDNSFGTHEFMDLVELLGTEAYVNGNVGSGTVREMSDWIEYLTRADDSPMAALRRENGRDEPWTVPFFGIGNEAWGCGGNMCAEDYAALARQYATYVRDHGDNQVTRIAAGASDGDYAWTEALMRAIDGLEGRDGRPGPFQAISLHYYTMSGPWADKGSATEFSEEEWYRTLSRAAFAEELVARHSTVMDRYDPHRKVGLVFDEWGTWWNVEPGTNPGFLYQQNTVRDALVASIHFDGFHRHADRLLMANIAQTVNVLQAMILTDPDSGALVLTPTYHVFAMNAGHQDAAALDAHLLLPEEVQEVDGRPLPLLSASASLRAEEGTALVSLSNLSADEPRTLVLDLRGRTVTGHEATVLTGASTAAHNTPEQPDAVAPVPLTELREHELGLEVTLPPHSFATVELRLGE